MALNRSQTTPKMVDPKWGGELLGAIERRESFLERIQLMYDVWGSGFVTRWTLLRPGDRLECRFMEGSRIGLVEPALDGVRSEQNSVSGCYRRPGSGDMVGNGCGE